MGRANLIVGVCVIATLLGGIHATACAQTTTLWNFLGIPQACNKITDARTNRFGNHPQRERVPALKRIGDPANLASKNPAIKTAAQVKSEEDLKRQKIKAIKYLGDVGCGCYPGVKEALLAALDDCTEEVRLAAARALAEAAGNLCRTCGQTCCDAEVRTKLADVAFGLDDKGCFKESSAEVRQAAAQALNACGGPPAPAEPVLTPSREVPVTPEGRPPVTSPMPQAPTPPPMAQWTPRTPRPAPQVSRNRATNVPAVRQPCPVRVPQSPQKIASAPRASVRTAAPPPKREPTLAPVPGSGAPAKYISRGIISVAPTRRASQAASAEVNATPARPALNTRSAVVERAPTPRAVATEAPADKAASEVEYDEMPPGVRVLAAPPRRISSNFPTLSQPQAVSQGPAVRYLRKITARPMQGCQTSFVTESTDEGR